jgi:hypothetical protein
VYFDREVPSLCIKSWLASHAEHKVVFCNEQKPHFLSIPVTHCFMHDTVRWTVRPSPPKYELVSLCTNLPVLFLSRWVFIVKALMSLSTWWRFNVIKWCKWPQWIISMYGQGWNYVPFVVLYCVVHWPEQGIWKPDHPSVCPVGQNEGELWGCNPSRHLGLDY